ncbi:transporter substrate-binding domain-containing protein [uncultured Aquitalea sp.]|uniref:substrate-binding periplasmic protein n=1 Tax=uncultured Aquitalea sp. TaxID=540272 RepID=UPI0025D7FED2|nr:transporter substrate-binding domain-containing protein [uncultured Aquitalea sp.]
MRKLCLWLCLWLPLTASALSIYTEDWPPVSFERGGAADGLAVDVVRAIQARIKDRTAVEVVPWARGYQSLLTTPDVMLFTVGRSEAREKLMTLLGPVAISQTLLLCRKGEAAALQALGAGILQRAVGAYRGSIFADAASSAGFVELDLAPTPQVAAQKLLSGRYDLWVDGGLVVSSILRDIHQSDDAVETVKVLDSLELYLAFSRGTSAAEIRRWRDGFAAIRADGTFRRLYAKWMPNLTPPAMLRQVGLTPAH